MKHALASILLSTVFAFATTPSYADDDFPGIEKLMGDQTFEDAGLNKLNDKELRALDAWLLRYTAGEAEVVRVQSEEVKDFEKTITITANIKQPFKGWSGDTVFYLDNGQVWKQRVDGRYQYSGDDTRVVIKKNFFGQHVMRLIGANRAIGVTLVR